MFSCVDFLPQVIQNIAIHMEMREIQSFVLLAKTGSLLDVARESGRTSGAVHKHLKTLEAELGARLYERRGGALRLTEAGQAVMPYSRKFWSAGTRR